MKYREIFENGILHFTTIDGKTIKQTTLYERENKINTIDLQPGLYLIKILQDEEVVLISKFLKL
jgi:hypothetical protein